MTERTYDLAIVGSAFGGALLAATARRLGRTVLLVERGRHPRFAIGESSTPLTNLLLEEIAAEYNLPELASFSKWGSWQRHHPDIGVGLKRGFSFYHHAFDTPWVPRLDRSNELLVAASPNNEIADTHWYRPDFDAYMAGLACSLGVDYQDETNLNSITEEPDGLRLAGTRHGEAVEFRCRFLVDASGARGFLWRSLSLPETRFESLPDTESLFAHFRKVRRWDSLAPSEVPFPSTSVSPQPRESAPFPPDDAALHHVFPGGWMWVLRFNNGITSAGVSLHRSLARELRIEEGAAAWNRLMSRLPSVAQQFDPAEVEGRFHHLPQLTFRLSVIVGERWALLPSAAGFVDPLFSTGFPLTLLGVQRLARLFRLETVPSPSALQQYGAETHGDLQFVANLIGTLLANLHRPAVFQAISMVYFAGATFSESCRRLGRPGNAPGFLLRNHPDFTDKITDLCERARCDVVDPIELFDRVRAIIDPFNVAGLADPTRQNWYPVDLEPLRTGSQKLGADWPEVAAMLRRCGMTVSTK